MLLSDSSNKLWVQFGLEGLCFVQTPPLCPPLFPSLSSSFIAEAVAPELHSVSEL